MKDTFPEQIHLTNLQNQFPDFRCLPASTLLVIILFLLKRDNRAVKSTGVNSELPHLREVGHQCKL